MIREAMLIAALALVALGQAIVSLMSRRSR